jgi:hypothetical protein
VWTAIRQTLVIEPEASVDVERRAGVRRASASDAVADAPASVAKQLFVVCLTGGR